jgi:hypothetical protein
MTVNRNFSIEAHAQPRQPDRAGFLYVRLSKRQRLMGGHDRHPARHDVVVDHPLHHRDPVDVKPGQGLVEDPQQGASRHQPCQRNAPALAEGQHASWKIHATRQAHLLQRSRGGCVIQHAAAQRSCNPQVLHRGEVVLDAVGMTDVGHLPTILLVRCLDGQVAPAHRACGRRGQAAEDAQQAGLATPVAAPHQ